MQALGAQSLQKQTNIRHLYGSKSCYCAYGYRHDLLVQQYFSTLMSVCVCPVGVYVHGMSTGAHRGQKIGNGGPLETVVTATMSAARA